MLVSHEDAARPATTRQDALFELEHIEYRIEGRVILHPLSLSIPAGRVVGVIGHNGSGKSTLAKILSRQLQPQGGSLKVGGLPAQSFSTRQFACQVGYLPQQIPAAPGMTVQELVALGRYPWLGAFRTPGDVDRRQIERGMALTDVGSLADRLVDTLSGGERQRVWLAMLLAQDTRCLILDEPISALDIRHQVDVLGLVRQLCREHALSVIVVLHDVYMAGRYCDELIALRAGRIVARGNSAQLLTPEVLKTIYEVDMDVMIHPPTGDRVACLK